MVGSGGSGRRTSWPIGPLAAIGLLVLAALLGPAVVPHDPLATDLRFRLQPPVFQGGTWDHVMGTDDAGRDILSRIIAGARLSVLVAAAALVLGGGIGTAVGLVAGFAGGRLEAIAMRLADLTISLPIILMALVLATVFGPQTSNLIVAIAFVLWARFARVVRGEAVLIRELPYIESARVCGARPHRIVLRHVLPNVVNTAIVLASLQLGQVIITEASLSFLGAGVPPPEPAWGSMIALGRDYVFSAWWIPTAPGLAITTTVLALNLTGDWLRDRLDPRLRRL